VAKLIRRRTQAVPSVEEFLGLQRDARAAFTAGHVGALRDVITEAKRGVCLAAERRAYTPERILLPNGTIDASAQSNDLVALPLWAFDVVSNTALAALELGHAPRHPDGNRHWYVRYRASLIHWHRYVLVRRAVDAGYTQSDHKQGNPTAFDVVRDKLKGTSFGAGSAAMENSFNTVRKFLKLGEAWRYYRYSSYGLYNHLLDPDADVVILVAGIHGQTAAS
jgi:hypothetical protein